MNIQSKFILTAAAISWLVWGMELGLESILFPQVLAARGGGAALWGGWLVSGGFGAGLGWVASLGFNRRLRRATQVSRAWLRGDLSLRLTDPVQDDLGRLASCLDQLTRQLARDEQDLGELRARDARLTDQVRALSVIEERNRLARELHDGVKQHLFSLALTASAVTDRVQAEPGCVAPELSEMVLQMKMTAQTAQREMTRLIEGLRPASIQERGLAAALNDYTLVFGAREHLLIYLDVQGNDAILPAPASEALYLVAQEALHNIARHARATRVDVRLMSFPEQVTLAIQDNGVGFDQSQPHQGLGISNMQERLLGIGGRVVIESRPGSGTLVVAEAGLARPLPAVSEFARLDRNRPCPEITHWSWLGQNLTIPVGQTWPWLPADEVHLRRPLVELAQSPLMIRHASGLLGLRQGYLLQTTVTGEGILRIGQSFAGHTWRIEGANWSIRDVNGLSGKRVLYRNGQPLAAVQYQGRQMNIWSEIIYAGRGYRLAPEQGGQASDAQSMAGRFTLSDESGETLLQATGEHDLEITLLRPLPLPLMALTVLRIFEECALASSIYSMANQPLK